jgi:hypothetical protein
MILGGLESPPLFEARLHRFKNFVVDRLRETFPVALFDASQGSDFWKRCNGKETNFEERNW